MITIICVGKIKEKYIKEGIDDYLKRISKYTKINLVEIQDESFDKEKTLRVEAERILSKINKKSFIVTLEIGGNMIDSLGLSNLIDKSLVSNGEITFVIGGSYGLDDSVKNISNYKLSFSRLTFPHQLFRLLFLEQVYRSYKILNNENYHK